MIRPIDIRLNAAHPELPLAEAVTFTGAPSTVLIRGVPPNCGRWAITAVSVAATFPDGSTTTRAAVQSANGVWVATLPATATSGRTANGLRILADGIDENGEAVTGYILGVADFAVALLGVTPAPEPGETSWQMLYFDAVPGTLRKGDVAKVDGVLKLYNGTAWEAFATPPTLDDAMTRTSANGVKSSGIWSAIWGTLSALPAGFASLYDWCVAQLAGKQPSLAAGRIAVPGGIKTVLAEVTHSGETIPLELPTGNTTVNGKALSSDVTLTGADIAVSDTDPTKIAAALAGKASKADATLTERGYSEWNVVCSNPEVHGFIVYDGDSRKYKLYDSNNPGVLFDETEAVWTEDSATSLAFSYEDAGFTFTATRTALQGYQLGSQDDKPLASEAEAEALRTGKADVSAIPYSLVTKTVTNGAVALDDRASNAVTISATLSPNALTVNFPTAPTGKLRDFAMRLNIAAGVTAPEIAWPQGVTLENNGGEVPEIADGGTGGSSTILYFSETENDGTTAKFLVKSETLTAITQA